MKRQLDRIVAIDPGGAHVGWCEALWDHRELLVTDVQELTPDQATSRAEVVFPHTRVVIIEKFTLYPDKSKLLVGSEMETSQLIGALKYLARLHDCLLVMQPAAIKVPTESLMRHRGTHHAAVAGRKGGHAKDAETHLHHYIYRGEADAKTRKK